MLWPLWLRMYMAVVSPDLQSSAAASSASFARSMSALAGAAAATAVLGAGVLGAGVVGMSSPAYAAPGKSVSSCVKTRTFNQAGGYTVQVRNTCKKSVKVKVIMRLGKDSKYTTIKKGAATSTTGRTGSARGSPPSGADAVRTGMTQRGRGEGVTE
ncbi:hypothetical protein QCN29_03150 [Streptomyces sp. HNM0663]|uniref:Uncharacterized protein n=1 Tax=Streptomyces chengmaiensis TaxID=3040919 RepID=A0ABT6HGV4_9ACTN|nr:hypothetical protein [Streptomyces chengmaiensis]MDH2387801.1 hypothetical protein [Streptomyces chengmaiensis]